MIVKNISFQRIITYFKFIDFYDELCENHVKCCTVKANTCIIDFSLTENMT